MAKVSCRNCPAETGFPVWKRWIYIEKDNQWLCSERCLWEDSDTRHKLELLRIRQEASEIVESAIVLTNRLCAIHVKISEVSAEAATALDEAKSLVEDIVELKQNAV